MDILTHRTCYDAIKCHKIFPHKCDMQKDVIRLLSGEEREMVSHSQKVFFPFFSKPVNLHFSNTGCVCQWLFMNPVTDFISIALCLVGGQIITNNNTTSERDNLLSLWSIIFIQTCHGWRQSFNVLWRDCYQWCNITDGEPRNEALPYIRTNFRADKFSRGFIFAHLP